MRDYTVPHTKGEDFREKLLNFSLLWPLVAAFLGVKYLSEFWDLKGFIRETVLSARSKT